jgi:hypothetical protein
MGWQRWLNSNVMDAVARLILFGLINLIQLKDLGFINARIVAALEQRI